MIRSIILFLATASIAGATAPFALKEQLFLQDDSGSFLSVSTRFNGRNHYIQISKLSSVNYSIIWNSAHIKNLNQRAHGIARDAQGNIFVLGSRWENKKWEPLLLKYNSQGKLEWEKPITTYYTTVPSFINITESGSIFIGATAHNGKHYSARLYKLWSLGFVEWFRDYNAEGSTYIKGMRVEKEQVLLSVENLAHSRHVPSQEVVAFDYTGTRMDNP